MHTHTAGVSLVKIQWGVCNALAEISFLTRDKECGNHGNLALTVITVTSSPQIRTGVLSTSERPLDIFTFFPPFCCIATCMTPDAVIWHKVFQTRPDRLSDVNRLFVVLWTETTLKKAQLSDIPPSIHKHRVTHFNTQLTWIHTHTIGTS